MIGFGWRGGGGTTWKEKTMDPYKVLGVRRSADKEEIKEAFRRLALQFHPDKHSSSPDHVKRAASLRFNQVSDAYHFLLHHDHPPPDAPSSSSSRGGRHNSYSYGYARDARSHYKRPTGGSSYVKGGHGLSFHLLFQFLTSRGFLLNLAFARCGFVFFFFLEGGMNSNSLSVNRCIDLC